MKGIQRTVVGTVLCISCLCAGHLDATLTLKEVSARVAHLPINVVPDNADELNPLFGSVYKKYMPSAFARWADAWHIWRHVFSITDFKKELATLIHEREKQEFSGEHIIQIAHKPKDKIIIFGDLQGDIHSLVSCLNELEHQGILDDDFTIRPNNVSLVFNSNVIGRDPFNIETLRIIVTLMLKNPRHVFYIRGKYEELDYWTKFNLLEQLTQVNEADVQNKISLASLIRQFFNTLPYALYVSYRNGFELLRISGYGRDFRKVVEKRWGEFFDQQPTDNALVYSLKTVPKKNPNVHIVALVQSFDGIDALAKSEGLALVDYMGGAIIWSVFSAATRLQHVLNKFYYEAFAIIELGKDLSDATITLYNRDTRRSEPFAAGKKLWLISGQKYSERKELKDNQYKVGMSLDLSRGVWVLGTQVKTGATSCVNWHSREQNAEKNLKLFIRDDEYNPVIARENIEYLRKYEKVETFLSPMGSPTLLSVIDFIKTNTILVLFPVTGAPEFRSAEMPGIIHFRASYKEEVFALVGIAIKKFFVKRFAFFYQNDAYGNGALQAAREVLKESGITEWLELPYSRNITNFKETVEKIRLAQPEALMLFSTPAATQEMLRQLGANAALALKIFCISPLYDGVFNKFMDDTGIQVVYSRVVPDPALSDTPIAQEYRQVMDEFGHAYNDFSFESYIDTSLVLEALGKLKGDISREALRTYFESFKNYKFKGLVLDFDPRTRSLNHVVRITRGDDLVAEVVDPEKSFKAALTKGEELKKETMAEKQKPMDQKPESKNLKDKDLEDQRAGIRA